jgi:hypothetical protein
MDVHRSASGAWFTAIVLLSFACGGGTDHTDHAEHAPEAVAEPSDSGPSTTEATLAALAALDPDRLASLHDHGDHAEHADPGPREGLDSVDPQRIVIPTIGVDAFIDRAGFTEVGEMAVPDFGDAAWFTPSVKPGRVGPSVITGHVDSRRGPDVFFDLRELAPGDEIEVHGDHGEIVAFAVTGVEQHPKDDYPRERVHAATAGPELRLITCGGIFDRSVGHYDDNIIVFAERLAAT